jgi:glucose/mannose-6-phosphate isomerase
MLELVAELPEQVAACGALLDAVRLPAAGGVRRVVICGMGGSAAAGGLAKSALGRGRVSIDVHRTYALGDSIDESCLLVFSSYSGATEEVLSTFDDARSRFPGSPKVAITSGGPLAERAEDDGIAVVRIPGGYPPRAALGYGVGVLFGLLGRLGLVPYVDMEQELREAVDVLRSGNAEYDDARPATDNRAKALARRLYGKLPLIYASEGMTEAVAWRIKAQINENAKVLAGVGTFPELNHNEVVGWEVPTPAREHAFVLALRDPQDHPRVQRRFEITREVLGDRVHDWETIESAGQGLLARVMSLVQIGDYLSVYLAREYGVDPKTVDLIDRLKTRLAEIG